MENSNGNCYSSFSMQGGIIENQTEKNMDNQMETLYIELLRHAYNCTETVPKRKTRVKGF